MLPYTRFKTMEGMNMCKKIQQGLQAFFYDRDFWINTGELYGPIHL